MLTTGSCTDVELSVLSLCIAATGSPPKSIKVFRLNNGSNNLTDPPPIPLSKSLMPPPTEDNPEPKAPKV